jgi:hypothetical protein
MSQGLIKRLVSVIPVFVVLVLVPTAAFAQCPVAATTGTSLPAPTLYAPAAGETTVVGWVPAGTRATLIVCVNLARKPDPPAITAEGTFAITGLTKGQSVVVQLTSGAAAAAQFGPPSTQISIGESGLSKAILIGGIEQGTYSSLGQNINPFLQAFIEGPDGRITGWGRVRLLSAPQPSTQGIVSTFTDPTGQLTTQDYSKVGQALDFVAGPRIALSSHWSFIAGAGVTTPLNSQSVTLTYAAPPLGTVECALVLKRFTAANGYAPGLTAANDGKNCIGNNGTPVTQIAFSNRDRSDFLFKYGAGFRTSNKFGCQDLVSDCTPSYGVLDITFGQDEAVTRGLLRHVVFKLDGVLPIPTGKASYLYIFGSAYLRLAKNQDLSPLILQTASGATIPSASVIVLPLQIPDRDFYRIGVGLNINQIFCKMFSSTCPAKTSPPAAGSAPKATL